MGMNVKEKARMYRELAKLLGASFPMDKSIDMLLGHHPSGPKRRFLMAFRRGFDQRLSFAEGLRTFGQGDAGGMEMSLIEAGEKSGRLAQACDHLAHYFDTWHRGIREARGAMVYPLILLHLGVVLPEVSRSFMMDALGRESHPAAAIVWRLILFWLLLLVLWLLWRFLSRLATHSDGFDRLLNRLPGVGSLRRHWALARFAQVFHSGLLAAMRISECLRIAGEASQSGTLLKGANHAAAKIESGGTLSAGLAGSHCFSKDFLLSVATAETAGGLDREMARWADAEISLAAEAQHTAAEWYPKALYFAIVGYVAYRVVMLFKDYFGMVNNILNP